MAQRRTQQRRTGQRRRDAGHHLDVHTREFLPQLQQRPGHAVHSCVAAAHQGHGFTMCRRFQRPAAALDFRAHPGGIRFLVRKLRRRQSNISSITAQHVRFFQGHTGLQGHVHAVTRAKTHDIYFIFHRPATSNPASREPQPKPWSRRGMFPCATIAFHRCTALRCARTRCPHPLSAPQKPKQ